MMSKLLKILPIIVVVLAGFGYVILSDPELPAAGLFKATLKEFSKHSRSLDSQFKASESLRASSKSLSVKFSTSENPLQSSQLAGQYRVKMTVSSMFVSLVFVDADGPLRNQSIVLEPFIKDNLVKWKCINGSVLARVRTKNCRLGYGHSTSEMANF
jgi:hypothetical protein